jgi:protein-disulfide isomerase/uncharacterized membrane protein
VSNPTLRRAAFLLISIAGLIGVGISILMTWHHDIQLFGDASLQGGLIGCAASEEVNCDIVNTSEYSEILGVPIATWGIATYLLIALLGGLAASGREKAQNILLALGAATSAYAVFLYIVSKTQLNYVCLWCIRLYIVNFSVLGLSLLVGAWRAPRPGNHLLGATIAAFVAFSSVSVGAERIYRATLLGDEAASTRLVQGSEQPATAPEAAGALFDDPEGPAPEHQIDVKTEDGNDAILSVRADDAWKGNREASVVLVEFADLECGYCKRASSQLKRLYEAYGDEVLFVFKHFPMDPACNPGVNNKKHRYACRSAHASVCAQEQGRFWAFHDLAFKNQHQLKDENLRFYAEAVELDLTAYDACMDDRASAGRVYADAEDGTAVEAHGTPRIFIDGRLYRAGTSAEQMAVAIERALGRSTAEAREGASALAEARESITPIPADVPEMQHIKMGTLDFHIDTFEATLLEGGSARSGVHEIPATQMSWFAARDACTAAGKRLCTEEEWVAACQNAPPVDDDGNGAFADDMVEGTSYPYADYHNKTRCWDGHSRGTMCGPEQDQPCRPVYTGELPGCVSEAGVYDLTGNVEEWVGASAEQAVLLGGSFDTSSDHARCYRRNDTYGPGFANVRTGFRCCK